MIDPPLCRETLISQTAIRVMGVLAPVRLYTSATCSRVTIRVFDLTSEQGVSSQNNIPGVIANNFDIYTCYSYIYILYIYIYRYKQLW